MTRMSRSGAIALLTVMLAGCSSLPFIGSEPPPQPVPQAAADSADDDEDELKPYDEIITEEAVSDSGLFITHQLDDELYFEIPREALGVEMVLVTTIARNANGDVAGTPLGNRILVWEQHGKRILLRSPSFSIVADSTRPVFRAVEASTNPPIVASFDIEAWGPDSAAVVEVTDLYTKKSPEFSPRTSGSLESDRTFIERARAFPENVEIQATQTYTMSSGSRTETLVVHWSMVKLPERPMAARMGDYRVGYFSVGKTDYGTDTHGVDEYWYITRWRLECPPGQSNPCEPVKPIVYYVDPATPRQWVPYIKQGIEDWQEAFEEAGFRNAIVAADPPDDPDWAPEDARYSVVRWMPSTTENAMGPHVHDPRTGEILESDIHMYHNVMNLLRKWYFVQVGALDQRAQRMPIPDELMGRLVRYVVAHEVGHTLGLMHNMKASSMYPADSLRDESFLRRMGHVSSIMDYARFNYVAQPEDDIPPELLVPMIGPYDRFAISWGYRPIPAADGPRAERPTLDRWARRQDDEPWLRFSTAMGSGGVVAGELAEAVGDADPVYSTEMGIRNIRRTVPLLIDATVHEGEDYSDLREMYLALLNQWANELFHVVDVVGSVEGQEKYGGQGGIRFQVLPAHRQREAVSLLNEHAFQTPEYLLDLEVLRRIEARGAPNRISRHQRRLLSRLVGSSRVGRLVEFEAMALPGEDPYPAMELMDDVREGVWSELRRGSVRIEPLRRTLQVEYLDLADGVLHTERSYSFYSDTQALWRRALHTLDQEIRGALPRAGDALTRSHLEAARVRIQRILDPRN